MPVATMTSKGQITIPASMRAKLRLGPGSKAGFVENAAGEMVLEPMTGDVRRLRGVVKYDGPPVSIDEMNAARSTASLLLTSRTSSPN